MNTHLPPVPSNYSQRFFNQLVQQLTSYFTRVVSHDEQTPHIILRSPNGSRFMLSVDDAGALVIVQAGNPPP